MISKKKSKKKEIFPHYLPSHTTILKLLPLPFPKIRSVLFAIFVIFHLWFQNETFSSFSLMVGNNLKTHKARLHDYKGSGTNMRGSHRLTAPLILIGCILFSDTSTDDDGLMSLLKTFWPLTND